MDLETREESTSFGDMALGELGMFDTRVVDFDDNGNMYVTRGHVCGEHPDDRFTCIVQISPDGRWRQLEKYVSQSKGDVSLRALRDL